MLNKPYIKYEIMSCASLFPQHYTFLIVSKERNKIWFCASKVTLNPIYFSSFRENMRKSMLQESIPL